MLLGSPAFADDEKPTEAEAGAEKEEGEEDGPAKDGAPEEPPSESGDDKSANGNSEDARPEEDTLHKLYVPFKDLEAIFRKEGEGVFLPYKEFRRLWDRAHVIERESKSPPVPYALHSAEYRGRIDPNGIRFEATLEVEVLSEGWQRIPLPFRGIAIEAAMLGSAPARLVPAKHGYDLLLNKQGRHELKLVLRDTPTTKGDTQTVAFSLPPVPLAKMSLSVPGTDSKVTIVPQLARSERPGDNGRLEVLAFLGPISKLSIRWRRQVEDAPTLAPLVFCEEEHDVTVDRGVVRSTMRASLAIHRSSLSRLRVTVPKDAVLLFVRGEGLESSTRTDDGRAVDLVFRAPVREKYAFEVGLERALDAPPTTSILPLAAIDRVERERGFLRVRSADGVKVEAAPVPGLMQVDLEQLPKTLRGGDARRSLSYRFATRPSNVSISVEALAPRVAVTSVQRVGVRPEVVDVMLIANVGVERAGIFELAFTIPAGLEINDAIVTGAEVDDWVVDDISADARVLRIALRDRLMGSAKVELRARTPIAVPDESGSTLKQPLPMITLMGAEHVRGYLLVHVDRALDRREEDRKALTVLDASSHVPMQPAALHGEASKLPLVFRFEYRESRPALSLVLERKAPTVTCKVETSARLEPARTRLSTQLGYNVEFRGVDQFRFSGPLALAERVHVGVVGMQLSGPEVETKPADALPDWKPLRGVWTVRLASPKMGSVAVVLDIDDVEEKELASGSSRETQLPRFIPLATDGTPLPATVHHVAVRRDPLLEVAPTTVDGGEEIDSRELPKSLQHTDNFLAFRSYAGEHGFSVRVTKHDYEPVAEVVVSHMHLDTVIPLEGRATTEAYLAVRNNDRQYLELRLPEGANIRALRIGGKTEMPRVGREGTVLLPLLSGLGKDEVVLVALVYDHDVERSGTLTTTMRATSPVPIDVAGDMLTWRVFPPESIETTSYGGSVFPLRPHRSWAARMLGSMSGLFVTRPGYEQANLSALMRRFQSPFTTPKSSRYIDFQGRLGTGDVELSGLRTTSFRWWKAFWFLVSVLGTMMLLRLRHRIGVSAWTVFLALFALLFALLVVAGAGFADVLNVMLAGVGLVALAMLLRGLFAGVNEWRYARAQSLLDVVDVVDPPIETPIETPLDPDDTQPSSEGGVA